MSKTMWVQQVQTQSINTEQFYTKSNMHQYTMTDE